METELLKLTECPSFDGPLLLSLVERPGKAYVLVCVKKPPLNSIDDQIHSMAEHLGIEVPERVAPSSKPLEWEVQLSAEQVAGLLGRLEEARGPLVPSFVLGLDGTSYTLELSRGLNRAVFHWWVSPPAGWKRLGVVASTLLRCADAKSRIKALDWKAKRRFLWRLQRGRFAEERRAHTERVRANNRQFLDLVAELETHGLVCPRCGVHSRDISATDKSPENMSFFVCPRCARSFRPEDMPSTQDETQGSEV